MSGPADRQIARKAQARRLARRHNAELRENVSQPEAPWPDLHVLRECLSSAAVVVGKHPADTPRPELSYDEFQKFAAIARVPDDDAKRRWLYDQVSFVLRDIWQEHRDFLLLIPALRNLENISHRLLALRRALARASAEYLALVDEYVYNTKTITYVCAALMPGAKCSVGSCTIEEEIDELRGAQIARVLEVLAAERKDTVSHKSSRRPPRPRSIAHTTFMLRVLTHLLRPLVAEAGGKLSFNRRDPNKGTLVPALQFLAPYLPPKAIPRYPPLETLKRIVGHKRLRAFVAAMYGD
jgi:hypothetical protein